MRHQDKHVLMLLREIGLKPTAGVDVASARLGVAISDAPRSNLRKVSRTPQAAISLLARTAAWVRFVTPSFSMTFDT